MTKDLAASVRARLLNIAKSEGSNFNQLLVRYALERFLYRLSQSTHADRFLLKGALLFTLWYDMPHRPTRDADLLGMTNSRVKDYLDLSVMLDRESLNMNTLAQAISATFTRRGMAVPTVLPMGLSDEFAADPSRQALWSAFIRKNDLAMIPLADVVTRIRSALEPAMGLAARTPKPERFEQALSTVARGGASHARNARRWVSCLRQLFPLKHQWSRQSLGKTGPGRAKADLYRQDYRHFDEVQHWRGFPGDLRGMHVSRSIEVYRAWQGVDRESHPLQGNHRICLEDYRHHCA